MLNKNARCDDGHSDDGKCQWYAISDTITDWMVHISNVTESSCKIQIISCACNMYLTEVCVLTCIVLRGSVLL